VIALGAAGGAVVVLVAVAFAVAYNRFVHRRNAVRDAWADVDVELRRRHDLIPNLALVARGYAVHEHELLEGVARARAAADAGARSEPEQDVVDGLRHLVAVVEAVPELRAGERFRSLQHQLAVTEDRIAVARRMYNSAVRVYDTGLETFPGTVVARLGGFRRAAYFDVEESVRRDVPSAA
jgi:LemA protein